MRPSPNYFGHLFKMVCCFKYCTLVIVNARQCTSTDCKVDFDGCDEADGERSDEYVRDDVVVGERQSNSAHVFALTVCVQYGSREQRTDICTIVYSLYTSEKLVYRRHRSNV